MLRAFQHAVFGLLALLYLSLSIQRGSTALAVIFVADPQQQPVVDHQPHEDEALRKEREQTHQIWAELRESEPTWRETIIDARPAGLPGIVWYYVKIIFRALFMNAPARVEDDSTSKLSDRLQRAVDWFETVAPVDNDALFLLAEMNFFGNFSHPRRPEKALLYYQDLADSGNATAQHMLGVIYATGLANATKVDQAKAQLYYTFAAEQGEIKAEMTLAHRYHMGIGTVKNCDRAVEYYKRVADKAMQWWSSGPPGGESITRNAYRWVDEVGGSYGEGASWSSSGPFAPDRNTVYSSFDDVLEFLDMRERQGDFGASFQLGKHFYDPPRGFRRNLKKARSQFLKVASQYWTRDGKINPKAPKNIEKTAAKAAAYLGRMFLRGEGTEQNFEKAIIWFKRGISGGDAFAQYHLGLMYRDGLGVPQDGKRAATYLLAASEQQLGRAMSAVGVLFLDQGDWETAGRYFEQAKNLGVSEGFYYLGEFANQGLGRQQNCHHAATYYKIVAEKAELLHSSFIEANSAYEYGDYERAFIATLLAAEQGSEAAQANVAFLLDKRTSMLSSSLSIFTNPLESVPPSRRTKLLDNDLLAQVYYTRSAHQQNIDSLIKAGDYHRLGIGTPTRTLPVKSNETTASTEAMYSCYSTAAEHPNAAQALWNMGWMHENGIGTVEQDFHMAKRYYDLALEMNKEAYLPVKLALLRLRTRSWWNSITGGKVKGMEDGEDEKENKRPKSISEWIGRFIDAAVQDAIAADEAERQADGFSDDLDHVAYGEPGMPGGDNEYYYSGVNREGGGDDFYEDFDDGILESLIIIALAGALALLVYVRAQRQRDQRERNGQVQAQAGQGGQPQQQQQQPPPGEAGQPQPNQQPDRGFMPNPGDPEYLNWVAGGIGH